MVGKFLVLLVLLGETILLYGRYVQHRLFPSISGADHRPAQSPLAEADGRLPSTVSATPTVVRCTESSRGA